MADENKLDELEAQKQDESAIGDIMSEVPEPDEPSTDPVPPSPVERGANRDAEPPAPPVEDTTPPASSTTSPPAGESGHDEAEAVSEVELVKKGKLKTEAELEAELETIQPPKGAHPNVKKGIVAMKDKLREELKAARVVVEEATKKAKDAEDKVANIKPLDEKTEGELKSLREFRSVWAIEQEISSKFEPKIKQVDDEAIGLLKTWGLPESVEKFIVDNGGVSKMRFSSDMMPDGSETQGEWFKKQILNNISSEAQKEDLEDRIRTARQLARERQSEIKTAKAKPQEWIQARQQEQQNANKDWDAKSDELKNKMLSNLGDAVKIVEVKADFTPEVKAQTEKHNDRVARGTKLYDELLHNFSPEAETIKAMGAAQALYLSEYLADMQKDLDAIKKERDELRERVGKMKNSGRTAKQSNAPIEQAKSTVPDIKLSDEQAIDKMFKEIDQKTK